MFQNKTKKKRGKVVVRLLLIADDFTGALDTGIQFAEYGAGTKLLMEAPTDGKLFQDEEAEVLILDAETRHLSSEEAYRKISALVRRAKDEGVQYIYKKTDSALRGNIGSELKAVLEASGESFLAFVPAFPEMNRITVDGIHYIDGMPLCRTEFGRDPFEPVKSSRVEDLFREQEVPIRHFRRQKIYNTEISGAAIGIFDSVTRTDIRKIAEHLKKHGQLNVMAGCAGFARMLPEVLGLTRRPASVPTLDSQLLIACGSMNPITKRQIAYGETMGYQRVKLSRRQQLEAGYLESVEGKRWLEEIDRMFEKSDVVMIDTETPEESGPEEAPQSHEIPLKEARERIAERIGKIIRELLEKNSSRTLMIIGGDTLMGFVSQSGCREIIPVCEIERGTVLSTMEIQGKKMRVITKSGGFGKKELFRSIAEKIKRRQLGA